MPSSMFVMPFRPAFDSNSATISGAKAYFTLTGTNTPVAPFLTSALTTVHANPVIANAAGKFAPIFLNDAISYRVRIYDADGIVAVSTPLEEYDPYYGAEQGSVGPQGVAGDLSRAATRVALAAVTPTLAGLTRHLTEAGREGIFVFDSSNLATKVTADAPVGDYGQGIYVAPAATPTGASGAWVRKFSGPINVKKFGAKGDSNAAGAIGTDDTAAIQAALTYLNSIVGGWLYFPTGFYKTSAYLRVYPETMITGDGERASVIVPTHAGAAGANNHETMRNGSCFYSEAPINTSSLAGIQIRDIGVTFTSASNVGAAYYDQCGTYIDMTHVRVVGGKYGAVLNQSELADIDLCNFELQLASGAGVWLVNGDSLTPSASLVFTNRISVKRCQINGGATTYGIIDDGGYIHAFEDNNYNGGLIALRAAGVEGLAVRGGEWEASAGTTIVLEYRRLGDLVSVGPCTGVSFDGGFVVPTAGQKAIDIVSGNVDIGNWKCSTTVAAVTVGNANVSFSSPPEHMQTGAGTLTDADWAAGYTREGISYAAAAPTARYHRKGELVLNNNPADATVLGWRCTVSGTPGTWVAIMSPLTDGNTTFTSTAAYNGASGANPVATISQGGVTMVLAATAAATYIQSLGGVPLRLNWGGNDVLAGASIDAITSFKVNGTQVVSARGAVVADATDAATAITQLNALLARCRAHGLIS